jgi:Na+-transporting methylmalonyl-CoA/oxaloacetate decarboxylase gamma subunit
MYSSSFYQYLHQLFILFLVICFVSKVVKKQAHNQIQYNSGEVKHRVFNNDLKDDQNQGKRSRDEI